MLHDGNSGWVRAYAGMVFPSNTQVTIKTGLSGNAEIINANGERVNLPANSMKIVTAKFSADDVDTLRQFRITARDMMTARSAVRHRLAPTA
ncbi:MAG TPA: hypothetical protein VK612_04035 [Pyrinomonadaceae bacterium]|nr:hypothetical protein [Pyrinomonadaceae bacterium]